MNAAVHATERQRKLIDTLVAALATQPHVQGMWLWGSIALGSDAPGTHKVVKRWPRRQRTMIFPPRGTPRSGGATTQKTMAINSKTAAPVNPGCIGSILLLQPRPV